MPCIPNPARLKEILARLVAFDTQNPPGREAEAAAFLADVLRGAGFATRTDEFLPGRANVIATLDNGDGPVFAFNSHLDVVPAGDGWSRDPFRLSEIDGRLFGRGACDAKGPVAAMIETLRTLAAERRAWSGTLLGVFVADEEVASRGARHYVAKECPPIDYVVVGEPTSNRVVTAHKGSMRPIVRVHGETAHSGTPDLGVNAIFEAARLLGPVEDLHQKLRERQHPLVGRASLTVTRMNCGHADNVVPDRCDLMLDRRLVPGEDEEAAKQEIQDVLDVAHRECGVRAEIIGYQPTTGGASETTADRPIVLAALEAARAHGGEKSEVHGFPGGCDLVHFRSAGADGVVMGPGALSVAHKPDEFVPASELVDASLIYRDVALIMLRDSGAKTSQ